LYLSENKQQLVPLTA